MQNIDTGSEYGGWVPPLDYSVVRSMMIDLRVFNPATESCHWPLITDTLPDQVISSIQCPEGSYKYPAATVLGGCASKSVSCPSGSTTVPVYGAVTANYVCVCGPCFAVRDS